MKAIKQIVITDPGDPSVGIFPQTWTIKSDGGNALDLTVFDPEDVPGVVKSLEEAVESLFYEFFSGSPVKVYLEEGD